MRSGLMEGLIGASRNMKIVDTPMRVYAEAERRGYLATMERALGYAGKYTQKAEAYRKLAEEELIKDQKDEKEKMEELKEAQLKEKREEKIKAEKELEEKELEKKALEENSKGKVEDEVELSEEGKALVSEIMKAEQSTIPTVDNLVGYNKLGNVIKETGEEKISVKI